MYACRWDAVLTELAVLVAGLARKCVPRQVPGNKTLETEDVTFSTGLLCCHLRSSLNQVKMWNSLLAVASLLALVPFNS